MINCPICKKNTIAKVLPVQGCTGFGLTAINQNVKPVAVHAGSGFAVDIYACTTCGNVLLRNLSLINQPHCQKK